MRFVVGYDAHIGYDTSYGPSGRSRRVPSHDERALRVFLRFVRAFSPEVLVLGGDQLNLQGVSRHTSGKNLEREAHRLIEDYELLDRLLIRPIDDIGPRYKFWHNGNHEDWLLEIINSNPALEGIIMPSEYLGLESRGWVVKGSDEVTRIGKVSIMHGSSRRSKRNPAREYVDIFRQNIRFGHYHTFQAESDIRPHDSRDYHTGVSVPCLCRRDLSYMRGLPTRSIQGFLAGEADPRTGIFNDFVLVINNHRLVWGGMVYTPDGEYPVPDSEAPRGFVR